MSVRQFAHSIGLICRAENANRGAALMRHITWQGRKLLFPTPVSLKLSRSVITDDEPGGVISMVNMLGLYDYNNMHFVQTVLTPAPHNPPPVFFDVGANIGAYTLVASEIGQAAIVSLEPVPAAFAKLQRNVRLNGRDHVVMLPVAAGREPGQLRMICDGASVLNRVAPDGEPADRTIVVAVETLDAIGHGLALAPTVIKIDVEGHEPDVLAGATQTLSACHACLVENGDRPEIVSIMQQNRMAGPFYYQHRTATLQIARQALPEDQIFISPSFARAFPAITIETA